MRHFYWAIFSIGLVFSASAFAVSSHQQEPRANYACQLSSNADFLDERHYELEWRQENNTYLLKGLIGGQASSVVLAMDESGYYWWNAEQVVAFFLNEASGKPDLSIGNALYACSTK